MSPRRALLFLVAMSCLPGRLATAAPSFAEVGPAFLQTHCVSCHGPEKQKAGLSLDKFTQDEALLRGRKLWRELLQMVEAGEMPPEEKKQPTPEERHQFLAAAQAVFNRADNAPPDPGRGTVRRLNRTEYNNTVRDLLQIDFKPADDFPADDVGHGFDNIADVLTVSPMLLERYLAAADRIAEEVIPLETPKPPKRVMAARFCEPASASVPQDRFRPLRASDKEAILSGPLNTPAKMEPAGEYFVRTRIYAQPARAGQKVRVALIAAGRQIANPSSMAEYANLDGNARQHITPGRILKVFEVSARSEAEAQVLEVQVPPIAGVERIAVAALRPPVGQPPPAIFVEYLEHEGPLDARPAAARQFLVTAPGRSVQENTRATLSRFVPRAWRRPVSTQEMDRLCALVQAAQDAGQSWEAGMRRALTAVLASPKFVFRLEPSPQPENPDPHPIDEYQLATRLSYFLWSTAPDDELYRLAAQGKLGAELESQVRRMLRDPKARALVDNFAMQWLQIGRLALHTADQQAFPAWSPELRASMLEETRRFVAEAMSRDRSILDLLDADYTWVDRRLAALYGLQPPGGFGSGEWQRVPLRGSRRGGLLTQASILTVTSNPTRTSPVKRGRWVLEQLLGDPPPIAPPDIPSLDDAQRSELTGTFRQKLEQHRSDPNCAGCHEEMDAFGFALEHFNGIGAWRDRDETGAPIDASGELEDGTRIAGLDALRKLLRERKQEFARCLTEKMLIYALGRGLEYYDDRTVHRIQTALAANDYRFSSLILGVVKSDPFRMRRGNSRSAPATAAVRPASNAP